MGSDGTFGDAPMSAGRWSFFVPRMERPNCAPRPAFQIKPKMFYKIVFRFDRPGRCSATVWEGPLGGEQPQPRHVVARVGTA